MKSMNSIGNRWYRTSTLSGGAPFFIDMSLCLQSCKDVSCSLISLNIPCRYKLSCVKIYFPCLPGTLKSEFGLAIKIIILCLDIYTE